MKLDTSPPSAPLAFFTFMMLLAPVTNSEPHGVTLAGYCYVMRHGMKVLIVTLYCGWDLQLTIQTPSTAKKNEGSYIFALPYASLAYRRAELLLYNSSFLKVKTSKHVWVACHEI
jgi:hypothetical protein